MAINNKDDYEKLAKILYPSIEASGNVYYGQTRKLTMDEILGKNELNFESHIETFKQDDQTYKSYFNWKIGPLHGAIQVESLDSNGEITLKNFPYQSQFNLFKYCDSYSSYIDDHDKDIHGTVFAKYILVKQSTPIPNIIQSASFTTYETTFSAEFSGLYIADSNIIVIDNNTWFLFNDNRNFFITHEDYNDCLYVKIASRKHKSLYKDYIDKPFRITNVHNSTVDITLFTNSGVLPNDRFKYNKNNEGWVDCDENNDTIITLKKGDYVELKITADAVDSKVLHFGATGPFSISGNICSLYYADFATKDYESEYLDSDFFSQMFKNATALSDASKLSIPCQLGYGASLSQMFYNCTNLVYPPELPSTLVAENCYEYMFYGCSSLKYAPDLSHILELQSNCFYSMFEGCTALEYPQDILPAASLPYRCYYYMYSGCTSLKRTPLILSTSTSSNQCLLYMFDGCTSLKMACIALQTLGLTSLHWLNNVSEDGVLFVTTNFDEVASAGKFPQSWNIARNDFSKLTFYNLYNGYYCDKYAYNEPYAKAILSVSGSDCELNGRGILSDETKFNMLETSPLISDNIEFGKYDQNSGSLNQEIWGIKSFNSPILFRNGIYGECASLTTADISDVSDFYLAYDDQFYSEMPAVQNSAAELKVLPNGDFFKPDYNPRSLIEVLHTNTGDANADAFKMSVCQSGLYAYNKFDDTNKIRYIDPIVNELNNVPFTGKYASFVSSASLGTNIIDGLGGFDGRNEYYISVMSAGDAYIALKADTSNHLNTLNVSCDNVNISDNGTVKASQFLGKLPSISRATLFTAPDIQIGSICLICLLPTFSLLNYYSSKSYNHKDEPFTIYAVKESSFSINCAQGANPEDIHSFKYCINNGDYEAYTSESVINLLPGDTVKIICTNFYSLGNNVHSFFTITGNVNLYGNIGSLLSEDYLNVSSLYAYGDYVFTHMFYNCSGIYDASGLILPFSTLTQYCYFGMFDQCENLISAPSIAPGTSYRSHYEMFHDCINLKNAPLLNSYTFSNGCYERMFYGCTSLEIAPIIACISDPQLDVACFKQMFYNCTSLLTAPILTASTLKLECYYQMFYNCTSLKYVKCLATAQDIAEPSDMHWLDNTNVNGVLVLHNDSQGTTVNVSLTNPNSWSNLYVSNNNFLQDTTLYPGNIIHTGAFIYSYPPDSSPSDYPDINKSSYINQIGTITIASLKSFRDNSKDILCAESISDGIFYDCKLKLLSGCTCDSTSKLYCLAMRIE